MSDAGRYSAAAGRKEADGNALVQQAMKIVLPHVLVFPPTPFTRQEVAKLKDLIERAEAKFHEAASLHATAAEKYKDDDLDSRSSAEEFKKACADELQVAELNLSTSELREAGRHAKKAYDYAMSESAEFGQSYTGTNSVNDRHAQEAAERKKEKMRDKFGPGGTAGTNVNLP